MRLTDSKRETIVKRLLNHKFGEAEAALNERQKEFANKVYRDCYPEDLRKAMAVLPQGFLRETSHIAVQFGGDYERLNLPQPEPQACKFSGSCTKVYDANHPLCAEYRIIAQHEAGLAEQRMDLQAEARAVLDNCSTVNRLLTVWPELGPFCRDMRDSPRRDLMVPRDDLNKTFGLPV